MANQRKRTEDESSGPEQGGRDMEQDEERIRGGAGEEVRGIAEEGDEGFEDMDDLEEEEEEGDESF